MATTNNPGDEILSRDATAQAEAIARGEVTPLELVDAAIARIERLNPHLNCIIYPRFEKARAEAADLATLRTKPLGGVPFLMKDLVQTSAGEPFSWGWKPFKEAGLCATFTSYVAAKFEAAGLITLARTTVPEWGTSISTETRAWGATRNPWDPERSAGGSSGGAGAAVASRIVAIAHGNDAGGSIRIPASKCGLVGLKPSRGRTSLGPAYADFWHGLCEEGVLTRTVRDTAAALDAIAGWMPGDPYTAPPPPRSFRAELALAPGRLRIGFMDRAPAFHSGLDNECVAAVRDTARILESLGHSVEAGSPAALDDSAFASHFGKIVACHEAALVPIVEKMLARAVGPEDFDRWTWALIERGRRIPTIDYIAACDWINTFTRAAAEWWTGGFDILVTSTLAAPPPMLGTFQPMAGDRDAFAPGRRINQLIPFTAPWNVTGQPAISLPMHMSKEGLPVGVQFVAAYGREDILLRLAAQLEQAVPWANRRPRIHA